MIVLLSSPPPPPPPPHSQWLAVSLSWLFIHSLLVTRLVTYHLFYSLNWFSLLHHSLYFFSVLSNSLSHSASLCSLPLSFTLSWLSRSLKPSCALLLSPTYSLSLFSPSHYLFMSLHPLSTQYFVVHPVRASARWWVWSGRRQPSSALAAQRAAWHTAAKNTHN